MKVARSSCDAIRIEKTNAYVHSAVLINLKPKMNSHNKYSNKVTLQQRLMVDE